MTTETATATQAFTGNGHSAPNGGHVRHDHKGPKRLEIWEPPTDGLEGYFDVKVLDPEGVPPPAIIKETTDWAIEFDVWLYGDIWKCVSGTLCYEVYFERANDGSRYVLSELLNVDRIEQEFVGCKVFKDGKVHLRKRVRIPAGTLQAGEKKPGFYDLKAVLSFLNPCGEMGVIAGYDTDHFEIYEH